MLKWLVAPVTACAETFTRLPGTMTQWPFTSVKSRTVDSAMPGGTFGGSYWIVSVTGAAKTVPVGPKSKAVPPTRAVVFVPEASVAGTTVIPVGCDTAPGGTTSVTRPPKAVIVPPPDPTTNTAPRSIRNLIVSVRPVTSGINSLVFTVFTCCWFATRLTSACPSSGPATSTRIRKGPGASLHGPVLHWFVSQLTLYASPNASTRTTCEPVPLVIENWATIVPQAVPVHAQTTTVGDSFASNVPLNLGCGTIGGRKKKWPLPGLCTASWISNVGPGAVGSSSSRRSSHETATWFRTTANATRG